MKLAGQVQINRGEALLALNRFNEAEASFRNALLCMDEIGAKWESALAEGNLADLAQRQGHLHRALFHFERARRRFETDDAAGPLARLLAEQAETKTMLGLDAEALREFEESLSQLDECGLALESARTRTELGRLLARLQRFDAAGDVLARAGATYESLGHKTAGARVQLQLGELHLLRGETDEATGLPPLKEVGSFSLVGPGKEIGHAYLRSLDLPTAAGQRTNARPSGLREY